MTDYYPDDVIIERFFTYIEELKTQRISSSTVLYYFDEIQIYSGVIYTIRGEDREDLIQLLNPEYFTILFEYKCANTTYIKFLLTEKGKLIFDHTLL